MRAGVHEPGMGAALGRTLLAHLGWVSGDRRGVGAAMTPADGPARPTA
jgi:hypothetical protein